MEQISAIAKRARQRISQPSGAPSTTGPRPSVDAIKLVSATWARLSAIYGHRWNSQFKHADDPAIKRARSEWAWRLVKFKAEHVREAIDACVDAYPNMPPHLPEFVELCTLVAEREARLEQWAREGQKKLQKLPERWSKEQWDEHIKACRRAIAGQHEGTDNDVSTSGSGG